MTNHAVSFVKRTRLITCKRNICVFELKSSKVQLYYSCRNILTAPYNTTMQLFVSLYTTSHMTASSYNPDRWIVYRWIIHKVISTGYLRDVQTWRANNGIFRAPSGDCCDVTRLPVCPVCSRCKCSACKYNELRRTTIVCLHSTWNECLVF